MKKQKAKSKSDIKKSKWNAPDFGKYESFEQTHGPLVMGQIQKCFDKDLTRKYIAWIIFDTNAVPRKEEFECSCAYVGLNNQPSDWDNAPYTRSYSRKFKAVRYERF